MMTLIGSQTSPFVRRLRLLLANHPYQFEQVNIYSADARARITQISPLKLIPILKDGGQVVLDSREIFRYLSEEKNMHPRLSWDQGNTLTIIDGVNDSLVSLLVLKRSGNDFSSPHLYFDAQTARIRDGLYFLESQVKSNKLNEWNYLSISLFGLIDWIEFRELWKMQDYPELLKWKNNQMSRPGIAETDPRLT